MDTRFVLRQENICSGEEVFEIPVHNIRYSLASIVLFVYLGIHSLRYV